MRINFVKVKTTHKLWIKVIFSSLVVTLCSCSTKKNDIYTGSDAADIYSKGKQNITNGKFNEAIKFLEGLESEYPYGDYAVKSKLSLIYAYYKSKDYLQAQATADKLLKMYPNHIYADYAHYLKGVAAYDHYYSTVYRIFNIDRAKRDSTLAVKSFDSFKVLIEKFPRSQYRTDAHLRMIDLRNRMASHELYIARYYLAKSAYVAAANRAYGILAEFNGTPAVAGALEVMIIAYRNLGIPEFEHYAITLMENFKAVNLESVTTK